jgi:hypothetical protein
LHDLRPVVDDNEIEPARLAAEETGDRQDDQREGGPADDIGDRLDEKDADPVGGRGLAVAGAERQEGKAGKAMSAARKERQNARSS